MGRMNREKFLGQSEYLVGSEWSLDGSPIPWSSSDSEESHRYWGQEDGTMRLDHPTSSHAVISEDSAFMAVSSGNLIQIYELGSRVRVAEFSGPMADCRRLIFRPRTAGDDDYYLISESSTIGGLDGTIVIWQLNSQGQLISHGERMLDIAALAQESLNAIQPQLTSGLDSESMPALLEQVLSAYKNALRPVDERIRLKHLNVLHGCVKSLSRDGRYLVCVAQDETTQCGMRPADELPQIHIHDLTSNAQPIILRGHEDSIMYASLSPDGKTLVSAAWDQTFRLWDPTTGKQNHLIGPTGGQNWTCDWSPDSSTVLLSGMSGNGNGPVVGVYDRSTGDKIKSFDTSGIKRWIRTLSWSPEGTIAISTGVKTWLWRPLDGGDGDGVVGSFVLDIQDPIMAIYAQAVELKWNAEGTRLAVMLGDETVEVIDIAKPARWRFQRPQGTVTEGGKNVFWMADGRLAVLNGDGVVRFWNL